MIWLWKERAVDMVEKFFSDRKRKKLAFHLGILIFVTLLMANLSALVDHFHHPEIPYFDHEHLIIGGVMALLTLFLFGGLILYSRRFGNALQERNIAEEAFWLSERQYRNLFDLAGDIVFTISPDGTLTSLNPVFETVSGWPRAKWLGEHFEGIVYPDDLPLALEYFKKVLLPEKLPVFELRIKSESGKILTCEFTTVPQVKNGQVINIIGIARDITERKKSEDMLRRERDKAQQYLDIAGVMLVAIDANQRVKLINKKGCEILGYCEEDIVGKNWFDIFIPEKSREDVKNVFVKIMKGETEAAEYHENSVVTKNGEERLIAWRNSLIKDDEGNITGTLSSGEDITEHKQAEDALIDSEERYRRLVELSPDVVFIQSEGKIAFINSAGVKFFGADSAEELIGKPVLELMHPDYRGIVNERIRILKEERTEVPVLEEKYLRLDGSSVDVEVAATPFIYRGNPGAQVIARDITERKKAEEALRKSKEFIKNILETVDEGFIVIDNEYKIISANKSYLQAVNKPLEEVTGRHCYELSHHIYKPCHESGEDCPVNITFKTGEPHTALHTHYDSEGNSIFVETKSYPIKDDSGKVVSAIEVINNITEKKRLEDQLHHAQKMEAIGTFAGGIAHDFNNILTAIIGYANLLQMKMKKDEPLRAHVEPILASAERAANLTQSLLAFSRKQVINTKAINLNEIVGNVEKLLRRLIGEDIELNISLADNPMTVVADFGQMEQVLINLATNARDAMPDGGVLIIKTGMMKLDEEYIKSHGYGKTGKYAVISVTDTGFGMDEKTRERIFDPFFTTKDLGKGTGLGLSIVYGIIKQHNGYINVYSEPGKGTTFRIYLPLTKSKIEETKISEEAHSIGGTETILLAEDESDVREITKTVLEEFGYKVIEAVDGEDAVSKFTGSDERIELLLFDVIMPKKNGKETYEEIKKIRPDIKVIFMSGYPADVIDKKGLFDERINFVSKPISPTELLRNIREVLDKQAIS